MPRLLGKRSNSGLYVGLLLVALIAAAGCLEYFGAVNLVPNFGKNKEYLGGSGFPKSGLTDGNSPGQEP